MSHSGQCANLELWKSFKKTACCYSYHVKLYCNKWKGEYNDVVFKNNNSWLCNNVIALFESFEIWHGRLLKWVFRCPAILVVFGAAVCFYIILRKCYLFMFLQVSFYCYFNLNYSSFTQMKKFLFIVLVSSFLLRLLLSFPLFHKLSHQQTPSNLFPILLIY